MKSFKMAAACFVSYVCAYEGVTMLFSAAPGINLLAASCAFVAMVLLASGKNRGGRESYVWLAGLLAALVHALSELGTLPYAFGRIWKDSPLAFPLFFVAFGGMWVMCVNGALIDGRSGSMFIADSINAFILLPFSRLFARIKLINAGISGARRREGFKPQTIIYALFALFAAGLIFVAVFQLLRSADAGFRRMTQGIADIKLNINTEFIAKLIISLPFGAYIFGLLCGARERTAAQNEAQRGQIAEARAKLRRLPREMWCALMCAFALMYAVFFASQLSKLISALRSRLAPGALTMAEYAKQGFFEMCVVMTLNMLLMYLAEASSAQSLREAKWGSVALSVITGFCLLFALLAAAKLVMYLDAFGFTPLRLQGAWGISVLAYACASILIWIWHGRNTARGLIMYGALSLTVTLLI